MSAINLSCLILRLFKSLSDISATAIDRQAEFENMRVYRVAHPLLIIWRGLIRRGAKAEAVRRMAMLFMTDNNYTERFYYDVLYFAGSDVF